MRTGERDYYREILSRAPRRNGNPLNLRMISEKTLYMKTEVVVTDDR